MTGGPGRTLVFGVATGPDLGTYGGEAGTRSRRARCSSPDGPPRIRPLGRSPSAGSPRSTLALVAAAHSGRTVANGVTGNGWTWTPRGGAVHRPARHPRRGRPRRAATRGARIRRGPVHGGRGAEVLTIVVIVLAVRAGLRAWGPGRIRGMATRAQAGDLLGPGRLRRVASVVRPDLHPTGRVPSAAPGGATRRGLADRGRPRAPRR